MKKVIGLERVDYFSKKANRQVQGYNIHCTTYELNNLIGTGTIRVYMNDNLVTKNLNNLSMLKVEELLEFEFTDLIYNQYGQVIGFLV